LKAVDTNVLARFFVDDPDDPEAARQRPRAVRAMAEPVFVPVTVMLELEWVLRGFYELRPGDVARIVRALCGLANVALDDRDAVLTALDRYEEGMDFADALHLARSGRCSALLTFDRRLARRAARARSGPRVELLR